MARAWSRIDPALLAAVPLFAVLVWWAADDGGYAPASWLGGGLLVLGLGVVVALGTPATGRLPPAALLAAAAMSAYTLWSAVSILWADSPGLALEGTLRTAVYAAIFLSVLFLPWTARSARAAALALVAAVSVLGVVALSVATGASPERVGRYFLEGRLAWPLGYQNANAALWTMVALPALALGARRETLAIARPLLLGAATALFELALLSQSRGWLFSAPLVFVATFALVPNRLRLLVFAAPVAAAFAVAAGPVARVYTRGRGDGSGNTPAIADALDAALAPIVLSIALAILAGAAFVLVDRRRDFARETVRRAGIAVAILGAAAAVGGAVAAWAAVDGRPGARLESAWDEFRDNRKEDEGESHFSALGSTRYDFWRVALDEARANPVGGLGQDNFAAAYLRERENRTEEPRWAHSLVLRLLVHTGGVGLVLFLLFAAGAILAVARTREPHHRAAGAILLLPLVTWGLHGSVDWLWEYPALSGTAFACAGAAVALARRPPDRDAPNGSGDLAVLVRPRVVAAITAVAVAIPVALSFAAERLVERGSELGRPAAAALSDLGRAADLQPLASRPSLLAGLAALRAGRPGEARSRLSAAIDRDESDWFARFAAGLAASGRGDGREARRHFADAHARNPLETIVPDAVRRLDRGRPVDVAWASRVFRARLRQRFGSARTPS